MSDAKNYRKFLNSPEQGGTALVAFKVQLNKRGSIYADFSIKDCDNMATLEFYVPKTPLKSKKKKIENSKIKIAALREAIDEFEKAFLETVDEQAKRKPRKPRKK